MDIIGTIMNKVFGSKSAAATPVQPPLAAPAPAPAATSTPTPSAPAAAASTAAPVDVTAVLNQLAQKRSEKLNWQNSIVDLMKLLDMDSGLGARKQLAQELNYSGDLQDSAAMNIWLHKEVMKRFAANGGRLPDNLMH